MRRNVINHSEMILYDGNIHSLDARGSRYDALYIRGNRIAEVGSSRDILKHKSSDVAEVDLGGRCVIPSLIDAHAHLDREGLRRSLLSLSDCTSISDLVCRVSERVRGASAVEWVVFGPLGSSPFHIDPSSQLVEGRYPTRWDLDGVSRDTPVWIRSVWGYWNNQPPHVHVLNSRALSECGISCAADSPGSSVVIDVDDNGVPTGIIYEYSVYPVLESTRIPSRALFTSEFRKDALNCSLDLALSRGISGIYEGHGCAIEVSDLYRDLYLTGELPIRVYLPVSLPPWESLSQLERLLTDWGVCFSGRGVGDLWYRRAGIYVGYGGDYEGAKAQGGAWPYTGWAGFTEQSNSPDEYRAICELAAKLGIRVNTIATRNLPDIVKIWQDIDATYGISHLRWVLAHCGYLENESVYRTIRDLGCVLTTQPGSYIFRSGEAMRSLYGDRPEGFLAHKEYLRHGIPWALSSDNKPFDLFFALWSAVERITMSSGRALGPTQCVSVEEALVALTHGGAYVCFDEFERGRIKEGYLADLCVLDVPLLGDASAMCDVDVYMTIVDGLIRYGRS